MKTLNIDEEKNFLLLKDLRNVNDIFMTFLVKM